MEPIIVTTKQNLIDVVNEAVKSAMGNLDASNQNPKIEDNSKLIFGISGLASFLGVSTVTAQKIKNEQCFPIYQRGRTIVFKPDEVLTGMKTKKSIIKKK